MKAARWLWPALLVAGLAGVVYALLPDGLLRADKPAAKSAPAAEKPKAEAELARVTLTEEQHASLKLRSEPARTAPVQQALSVHGFIMAPPGQEALVAAPVSGHVRASGGRATFPVPGASVTAEQELFVLEPVLSPLDRAQLQMTIVQLQTLRRGVEGELAKAREAVTAAAAEYRRLTGLVKEKLRGAQDLEQATARLRAAEADRDAARDKLKTFEERTGDLEKGLTRPIPLKAPRGGILLSVPVRPGQYVAAATPLATIADLGPPWVRVAIAEQDLQRIDLERPAAVVLAGSGLRLLAERGSLVPQVDPAKHTADVLYNLGPALAKLPKGQRRPLFARDLMVTVEVPTGEKRTETVVPPAAVVYDAFGGTWIYVELGTGTGRRVFERRKVELGPALSEGQVVRPSLEKKDRVVVAGAAVLYSAEFHSPPPKGK
jgi:multidrug efflux pump subunit AcrA (membrane-fusion protein)